MNTNDIELDLDTLPWSGSDLAAGHGMEPLQGGDLLATIFAGQQLLMDEYESIEARNHAIVVPPEMTGALDDRDVQIRLKDLTWRCVEELGEAMNCLKNKPWKQSFIETDKDHYREEVADAFHFFVELCITSGIGPEELFKLYFKKHAVNQFRQRSAY